MLPRDECVPNALANPKVTPPGCWMTGVVKVPSPVYPPLVENCTKGSVGMNLTVESAEVP
jgi:hypothetical protein